MYLLARGRGLLEVDLARSESLSAGRWVGFVLVWPETEVLDCGGKRGLASCGRGCGALLVLRLVLVLLGA